LLHRSQAPHKHVSIHVELLCI